MINKNFRSFDLNNQMRHKAASLFLFSASCISAKYFTTESGFTKTLCGVLKSTNMKTKLCLNAILLLLFALSLGDLNGQYVENDNSATVVQNPPQYEVTIKSGKTYRGVILENTSDKVGGYVIIQFEDETTLRISSKMIKRIRKLSAAETRPSAYGFFNPVPENYLLGSSAFMPRANSGYIQVSSFLVPSVHYGFTDWFSLNAGFDWIFATASVLTYGVVRPFAFIRPKAGFELSEEFRVSFTPTLGCMPHERGEVVPYFTNLTAAATYGNPDNNITLNISQISTNYAQETGMLRSAGVLSTLRTGKHVSLLLELWSLGVTSPDNAFVVGFGVRYFTRRFKVDLGLYSTPELLASGGIAGDQVPIFGIPQLNLAIQL